MADKILGRPLRDQRTAAAIGFAVATVGALTVWAFWPRPSVGQRFYEAIAASPAWHQRLWGGPPRSIFLALQKRNRTGVQLRLPDWSFDVPLRPWCIGLDWSGADPVIRSVSFLRLGQGITDGAKGDAAFLSSHPAYTLRGVGQRPVGIIEIVDAHRKGFFSVPATCRVIVVHTVPRKPIVGISGIHIYYPRFGLDWAPAVGLLNPRGYLEFAAGLGQSGGRSHPNLCERALARTGLSSSQATRIIRATLSRRLSTLTDIQIVRQSLDVTGGDIRRAPSVGQAVWLTLLLNLSLFRNGPAVWVRLDNGRLLYFAGGRFGERALLFNAAGRAISAGAVGYTDSRWPWPMRLRNLEAIAIPFFSQTPPAWFQAKAS